MKLQSAITIAVLLSLPAWPALAGQVGISPTRATLTPTQRVQTLTLRNPGSDAVDYQITVKHWRMAADGEWVLDDLQAGDGLAVFPLAFRIAPGKAQVIRVGLAKAPVPGPEQAYRLFIRELPKERQAGETVALNILSQLSLPVFVNDGDATPDVHVQPGAIARRKWTFALQAAGDGHLDPKHAKLRLLDGAGKAVLEQDLSLNYVLAGATLPVTVALPAQACSGALRFELDGDAPLGKQQGTLPAAGQRSCGG